MNKNNQFRHLFFVVLLGVLLVGTGTTAAAKIPVLRFINPHDGETLSGDVTVMVYSPDISLTHGRPSPKKEVYFITDGMTKTNLQYIGHNLYVSKWDTTAVTNGKHELTAMEVTFSQPPTFQTVMITVNVQNVDVSGVEEYGLEIAALPAGHEMLSGAMLVPAPISGSDPGPPPVMSPSPVSGSDPGPVLPPQMPPYSSASGEIR